MVYNRPGTPPRWGLLFYMNYTPVTDPASQKEVDGAWAAIIAQDKALRLIVNLLEDEPDSDEWDKKIIKIKQHLKMK